MRRAVKAFTFIAAAAMVTSCGSSGSGSGSGDGDGKDSALVITDGGGTFHDALAKTVYKPCATSIDTKISSATYDYSVGLIKAQVQGAKEWDVVSLGAFISEDEAAKLFAPVDYSVVTADGLPKEAKKKYWVGYDVTGIGLGYRTDKYSTAPTDWSDLWDVKKFPGTGTLEKNAVNSNLELALLADGVKPSEMYPLDLDRAFKKLDELFDKRRMIFYDSGATMVQQYASGTATIGTGWTGRFTQAAEEKVPIALAQKNMIMATTNWAVLKTSKNQKAAMKFIDCASGAESQAAMDTELAGQIPVNTKAYELLDPKIRKAIPAPDATDVLRQSNDYWAENFDSALARWQKWLAKHGG